MDSSSWKFTAAGFLNPPMNSPAASHTPHPLTFRPFDSCLGVCTAGPRYCILVVPYAFVLVCRLQHARRSVRKQCSIFRDAGRVEQTITPSISYLMSFRPNELAYQQYKFVVGNDNKYRTEGVYYKTTGWSPARFLLSATV
jgi:hypothetical protein